MPKTRSSVKTEAHLKEKESTSSASSAEMKEKEGDAGNSVEPGSNPWTCMPSAFLDSSTFYGRLQLSMDELSYKDYSAMGGLIALTWMISAGIIYVVMFAPYM